MREPDPYAGAEEVRQPVRRHRPPPPTATADIMAQLARTRPEPEAARGAGVSPSSTKPSARRCSASIVGDMIEDPDAAFRTDALLYQDFLVRCRIRRVHGEPVGLPEFRRRLAVAKARVDREMAAGEPWKQALALSAALPDDVQSVFLIVAKAAIAGEPCPSGPCAGARLRHAFGAARAQASHLFRGAGGGCGAHRFPRQAHRRLSRSWLRDDGGRSRCAGRSAGRRGGRIRRSAWNVALLVQLSACVG